MIFLIVSNQNIIVVASHRDSVDCYGFLNYSKRIRSFSHKISHKKHLINVGIIIKLVQQSFELVEASMDITYNYRSCHIYENCKLLAIKGLTSRGTRCATVIICLYLLLANYSLTTCNNRLLVKG